MLLIDFKKTFFKELSKIYPETEISAFFNLLIAHQLKLSRVEFALNPVVLLNKKNQLFFEKALTKLKNQIPIQYIIGETEFYGLKFNVNNHVLIPRPETEELVEWILKSTSKNEQISILDIGTGSGCIAISLAKNIPNAQVYALDISEKAIETAKLNALKNEVNVHFFEEDILNLKTFSQNFDIIVSNPPYVRELEKIQMQENVLANEPHLALFVKDTNPLLFYEKISKLASNHLNIKGNLYFEINQNFGNEMKSLLQSYNFKIIELKKDIFDVDRMIKAAM